jgi:RNA polymerase sigma-70 factor (sigma-E family)
MIASVSVDPEYRSPLIDGEVLFRAEYRRLVRLAALMLGRADDAEEVVQDAFVKLEARWRTIRDPEKAAAWLRTAVVNGARSRGRRRRDPQRVPHLDAPAAESGALAADLQRRTIAALRLLPVRQREALVLKFYEGLSEVEIAGAMGVSTGSVKTHVHRGVAALRSTLGSEEADGR